MRITQVIAGLFLVVFGVSGWTSVDMAFWNLSHSVAFTLLPMLGLWLLWKTAEDAI